MTTSNQEKKGSAPKRGISVKIQRGYYTKLMQMAAREKRTMKAQLEIIIDAFAAGKA